MAVMLVTPTIMETAAVVAIVHGENRETMVVMAEMAAEAVMGVLSSQVMLGHRQML